MYPASTLRRILLLCFLPALMVCAAAAGKPLTGHDLVAALRRGGYVILMRHAQSPGTAPDAALAEPANVHRERQLDETGRATAQAMGAAFRQLRLPVGRVLSSPTYRALETARLAQFPTPRTFAELGDGGKSMSTGPAGARATWLRAQVARRPEAGTDTVILTHYPNISEAFPADAKGLSEGEALILQPDGHGAAPVVGRIRIEDWPKLAAAK